MIDELRARNVALIREASIRPAEGLTVLTGETGTGKTALLGALKLLVGERADTSLVREGTDEMVVEGRVFLSAQDADGVVVRRRVGADGRGRVDVDGQMASVGELANSVGSTVDLCGQHEHQRLLSAATHVELLDAFAGEAAATAHAAWVDTLHAARAAADELERVRALSQASNEALDEARFVLDRIDELSPSLEEYAELELALPRAEHAESLLRAAEAARAGLVGDDGDTPSALTALNAAIYELNAAARMDESLQSTIDALEGSLVEIEDAAAYLRDYRDSVELDPAELNRMQTRMASYQGLMRSYGPGVAEVLERRERAAELVAAADRGGEQLKAAERAWQEAEDALARAADALDEVRAQAAPGLAQEITQQMSRLEMGSAQVELSIERRPREAWSETGPSHVELMYRPAEGMSARPLRRIASGGEVSRVMLAAKVVLGKADTVDTLVFDEVDAGVGGATANALAKVLADLATTHQVIVVTHLAQVAVLGQRHYVVDKTNDAQPETVIVEVQGDERVHEIARMLSGDATDASLAHAREMLQQAG